MRRGGSKRGNCHSVRLEGSGRHEPSARLGGLFRGQWNRGRALVVAWSRRRQRPRNPGMGRNVPLHRLHPRSRFWRVASANGRARPKPDSSSVRGRHAGRGGRKGIAALPLSTLGRLLHKLLRLAAKSLCQGEDRIQSGHSLAALEQADGVEVEIRSLCQLELSQAPRLAERAQREAKGLSEVAVQAAECT